MRLKYSVLPLSLNTLYSTFYLPDSIFYHLMANVKSILRTTNVIMFTANKQFKIAT